VSGWVTSNPVRSGVELTYRATITDASPIERVQAIFSSGERLTLYPRNGQWARIYPGNLPQGVYPLTFQAVDKAGNTGYGSATLVVDNTSPAFTNLTVTASQPYAFLSPVQAAVSGVAPLVYYGVGTGSITVTATLTDNLAGLDTVAFPAAAGLGASYAQNGLRTATVRHRYTFDAATVFSGTVSIQAADRAGNTVTSNVVLIHDTIPPTITLSASPVGLTVSTS
jgi:hypothetical protein